MSQNLCENPSDNPSENPKFYASKTYGSVYYSQEEFGIKQVAFIEIQPDYDFDMVVVWQNTFNNELRWGHDSGCSCPSPFEDIGEWSQLNKLPENLDELKSLIETWKSCRASKDYGSMRYPSLEECTEFLREVEELVENAT